MGRSVAACTWGRNLPVSAVTEHQLPALLAIGTGGVAAGRVCQHDPSPAEQMSNADCEVGKTRYGKTYPSMMTEKAAKQSAFFSVSASVRPGVRPTCSRAAVGYSAYHPPIAAKSGSS